MDDAMRCDAMRYDAMRCDAMRCDTIRYDTIRYDTIRYDTIRYDTIRCDTMRCDAMRRRVVEWELNYRLSSRIKKTCQKSIPLPSSLSLSLSLSTLELRVGPAYQLLLPCSYQHSVFLPFPYQYIAPWNPIFSPPIRKCRKQNRYTVQYHRYSHARQLVLCDW
jgi:pentapeptide MXKDX repeat protein